MWACCPFYEKGFRKKLKEELEIYINFIYKQLPKGINQLDLNEENKHYIYRNIMTLQKLLKQSNISCDEGSKNLNPINFFRKRQLEKQETLPGRVKELRERVESEWGIKQTQ